MTQFGRLIDIGVNCMLFRLCICAVVLSFVSYATSLEKQSVFVNGEWFDGTAFQKRSAVIKNGKIEFRESDFDSGSAEVIDLKGGFVIPPYCEAHNHNIGVGKAEEKNKKYLDAGVFYIQILNNAPQTAEPEKEFWACPETADVAFAHGGLTGVGGHPVEILEGRSCALLYYLKDIFVIFLNHLERLPTSTSTPTFLSSCFLKSTSTSGFTALRPFTMSPTVPFIRSFTNSAADFLDRLRFQELSF